MLWRPIGISFRRPDQDFAELRRQAHDLEFGQCMGRPHLLTLHNPVHISARNPSHPLTAIRFLASDRLLDNMVGSRTHLLVMC